MNFLNQIIFSFLIKSVTKNPPSINETYGNPLSMKSLMNRLRKSLSSKSKNVFFLNYFWKKDIKPRFSSGWVKNFSLRGAKLSLSSFRISFMTFSLFEMKKEKWKLSLNSMKSFIMSYEAFSLIRAKSIKWLFARIPSLLSFLRSILRNFKIFSLPKFFFFSNISARPEIPLMCCFILCAKSNVNFLHKKQHSFIELFSFIREIWWPS